MQHKAFYVLTWLVLLSLFILPVGSAQAQDTQPPRPGTHPSSSPHTPPQFNSTQNTDLRNGSKPASTTNSPISSAALVALGQPGLSFRYVQTFGTPYEPYLADGSHINGPAGIYLDASSNLYVAELRGYRLLKFNKSGVNTQILGHAGIPWAHDDYLAWPYDVAKDAAGNIWVVYNNSAVKEFDNLGNLIQYYPYPDPWVQGDTNDRFNNPHGIAFDASGLMYIADTGNHRIQVYDVSGEAPVYQTTIGETGVPGINNTHFNEPYRIAFDSLDRLYVLDQGNSRIQRCTKSGTWNCAYFFGVPGVPGNDLGSLDRPVGIVIDSSDHIYIADGNNYRILKCTTAPLCSLFAGTTGIRGTDNSHFWWPEDVAVDPTGNVFVSDLDNHRIQKFNSAGVYQSTVGVNGVPYLTDADHINAPWGITLNSAGEMYVLENRGYRLLKLSPTGTQLWTVGEPGIYGSDNDHLSDWWSGPESDPAVDNTTGWVYVPDTSNNRVQIFNSSGAYIATLGEWGTGDYQFSCTEGIAISPVNRDVYVVDRCNHRIQVYTIGLVYKATLGETAVEGSDNTHFRWLSDVAVANNGDIFVADADNFRVQKCHFTTGTSYTCTTFAGETGMPPDGTYNYIHPISVALDASNRVYVVDDWNGRVLVYDSAGALLAVIAGWDGADALNATSVALDGAGNVYITNQNDHRIQKFAPGVPGWQQSNIEGFGDPGFGSGISLAVFNNQLYSGAGNWNGKGASIWRTTDSVSWSPAMTGGFGSPDINPAVIGMTVYQGKLYAGTGWNGIGAAGQLWRTSDGSTWNQITGNGMGVNTGGMAAFTAFGNNLYAGTCSNAAGVQIWRSATGDSGTWSQVVTGGLSTTDNNCITGLKEFNGALYAAVENPATGAQIWRSTTGNSGSWTKVNNSGFGSADNDLVGGFAIYGGYLYVGTRNGVTGAQLWRTNNGTTWTSVMTNGFGDVNNDKLESLYVYNGALYAGLNNAATGLEVWRSTNGTTWTQANPDGFGSTSNRSTTWSNTTTIFNNSLYMGVDNPATGFRIWKKLPVFGDVPASYWASSFIERLYNAGVTGGCTTSPLTYCPGNTVSRAQMAIFLLRAEHGSNYIPPTATGTFLDVPKTDFAAPFIEQLAKEGITGGCGGGNYCPSNPVTRAQMAIFLLRAEHGSTYTPPAATGMFLDVPKTDFTAPFIEQLANEGITGGCGGGNYCPAKSVTRDQMAIFLVRAFTLP